MAASPYSIALRTKQFALKYKKFILSICFHRIIEVRQAALFISFAAYLIIQFSELILLQSFYDVFVFYEYSALLNIYNCATEKEIKTIHRFISAVANPL